MPSHHLEEFKKYFLLEFTRQLIRNSSNIEVYKLTRLLEQEKEEIKKKEFQKKRGIKGFVSGKIKQREYAPSIKKEGDELVSYSLGYGKGIIKRDLPQKTTLFIPEPVLPDRLRYLKPLPTKIEVDLGKINNLIHDPVVRVIECNGSEEGLVINGPRGKKETSIVLTKEEINEIIKKFSEETKIPLQEGFFKVAFGRLIISAIYSESIGSKFIIKKMPYQPKKNQPSEKFSS